MRPQAERVLLVEDNPQWRTELRRWAAAWGHAVVHEAGTADAALAWLRGHAKDWDLALVDAFLVQGNGYTVLKQCRSRSPGQRVVMLSNYARPEAREQALLLGADRFFDKHSELDACLQYCFAPQGGGRAAQQAAMASG